jgi:hypothetical protein
VFKVPDNWDDMTDEEKDAFVEEALLAVFEDDLNDEQL